MRSISPNKANTPIFDPTCGFLHHYAPRLVAFEYRPRSISAPSPPPQNTLLFIGGLRDGLLTVPYTNPLAIALPPTWCLVEILFSSSYIGWGTSSLGQDVLEIGQCVAHLKKVKGGQVVLMGHSTGSQDVMHYLVSPEQKGEGQGDGRPRIMGGILQASVSDRESLVDNMPKGQYEKSVEIAQEFVREGRGEDVLPSDAIGSYLETPICARRWLSLASPGPEHDGEDDYFSSDLSDLRLRRTFGRMGKQGARISILFGEKDQYVPKWVDRKALVERWEGFVREGGGMVDEGSGIVKGANHNLDGVPEEVTRDLAARVQGFLERLG